MTDRPRKKRKPAPPRATKASRLIVQFNRAEDPSEEQTAVVRDLVKRFAKKAKVAGEMPGALKVDVGSDSEEAFREAVKRLPEWDVANEGKAEMPPSPHQEDLENDDETS